MRTLSNTGRVLALLAGLGTSPWTARAEETQVPLARGVRGLITQAAVKVEIDGQLREWTDAYCTPVHYNHADLLNRAAQFFYLWDDQSLYIGLRALDQKRANFGSPEALWNGDAVEFYLDTRPAKSLRGKDWSAGAIHLFFTPFEGARAKGRWAMRQGIATSNTVLRGVEVAATDHDWGYEVEFKVPWANFPEFQPKLGALVAIDAELCSGDGAGRTDRTFAFGSPLSVTQPASLGLMELVRRFDPDYLPDAGPAAFPLWVETPWSQKERAQVQAVVAIPPQFAEVVGMVEVRIHDADGKVLKTLPTTIERFGPERLQFVRAVARWSIDDFAPNRFFVTARVLSRTDKPLVAVAPRLVHEAQMTGR